MLRFGTKNINTSEHWTEAWSRHGRDGYRATGEVLPLRLRVKETIPVKSTVLDVGCGVGEIMTMLRSTNSCDCFGVDIAPSAVSAVLEKGMKAKVAALPEIPYSDEMFDAVVCTETLEHVTNVDGTLRSIRRVMRPGAILVLSVPDGNQDDEDAHVHRFTRARLEKILERWFAVESLALITDEKSGSCPSFFAVARRPHVYDVHGDSHRDR